MKAEKVSEIVHKLVVPKNLFTLQCSDIHYDSVHCDRLSLKNHFNEVKEKDGQIFIYGDLFDVMGCYKDPRTKAAHIRTEYIHRKRSYLDLVIDDVYEFLKPYRDHIAIITYGNHESSIMKHRDTDPIDRLVFRLNQLPGKKVMKGQYQGWIKITQEHHNKRSSFTICYHHGKGGNAKRSKGVLYSQMDAFQYPDANLIVSGHDHNKLYDPSNVRDRVDDYGRTYLDTIHWIKSGSYALPPKGFGYVVEKGMLPKRLGGWFADINQIRQKVLGKENVYTEPTISEAVPVRRYVSNLSSEEYE